MTWLNESEIEEAKRYLDNPWRDEPERPNLKRAVATLQSLMNWTNANSDGWVYWNKPSRAAKTLQGLIYDEVLSLQGRTGQRVDITEALLKRALTPIKAFLTRQEVPHEGIIH